MIDAAGIFYGGKHKGKNFTSYQVDADYLRWLYWNCDFGDVVDERIIQELNRRREPISDSKNNQDSCAQSRATRSGSTSSPNRKGSLPIVDIATLDDIITAGRQALAKRNHPDIGGDPERMKEINITADKVLDWLRRR